ncbi:hypothetical protein H5399_04335 [Tessaracoccus sp. MC1627]|uniref:hypothetical protein n=1 Tax=Tessaracoccus sp. MC1627 TaxID=2760312 RepID=UPI0015FFBC61|nr:hypothetical protein [Tessaracoccus sp. MC1627]MBB1511832.1 hypothetical protein [Tessaracoccus sp. MC1627]
MGDRDLSAALGLALTGERLPLSSPSSLPEELARLGFDAGRLAALRTQRQEACEPWPFPVPLEERRALGFARFDAALAEARRELGLTGLTPSAPASRPLDRHEQRLADDRPPHW